MGKFSNILRPANAVPRWPFTINCQSEQARGVVAWWPSDPIGGDLLFDLAGGNFNAVSQSTNWSFVGGYPTPTGTGNILKVPYSSALLPNQLTLSIWAQFFSHPSGGVDNTLLAAEYTADTLRTYLWLSDVTGPLGIRFGTYSGSLGVNVSAFYTYNEPLATWHHFVGTYDGAQFVLYQDGVQKATQSYGTGLVAASPALGLGYIPGLGRTMNGQFRDARIYNRALSASEVWALYDPATRYELYQPLSRRVYGFAPSVAFTYKDASARLQALSGVKTSSSILRSASARLTTQSTVRSTISRAVAAHAEIIARSTLAAKANRLAGASAKFTTRSTVQATPTLLRGASVRIQSRASMQARASAWRAIAAQLQARSGILCGTIEQLSIAPGRLFDVPYQQRIFRVRYEDRTFRVPRA